jgi:hypothetical protein
VIEVEKLNKTGRGNQEFRRSGTEMEELQKIKETNILEEDI